MIEQKKARVLLVEDEATVAMLLEDMLEELGYHTVASVARIGRAFEMLESLEFDVAILDVNINGELVFPLAQSISEKGRPIVFSSGYGRGGVPTEFDHCAMLSKPFSIQDLERALEPIRFSAAG